MDLISYPIRLTPSGAFATVEDGEDYYAEELAMLIKTHPGERSSVPDYGINDPTFDKLGTVELLDKVNLFGPPIRVTEVTNEFVREGILSVEVQFEPIDEDDDDFPTYGADEYTESEEDDYDDDDIGDEEEFDDATD